MNREPTKEEIKRFWEYWGFVFEEHNSRFEHWWTYFAPEDMLLEWHEKHQKTGFPPLDLNSLFRYAVPKAIDKIMARLDWSRNAAFNILFSNWRHELKNDLEYPALALFWALEKVREANNE